MDSIIPITNPNASTSQSNQTSPKRRARLQRSERLQSDAHTPYSSWETLVRDSFGQIAWPIRITSWELVVDGPDGVPTRPDSTMINERDNDELIQIDKKDILVKNSKIKSFDTFEREIRCPTTRKELKFFGIEKSCSFNNDLSNPAASVSSGGGGGSLSSTCAKSKFCSHQFCSSTNTICTNTTAGKNLKRKIYEKRLKFHTSRSASINCDDGILALSTTKSSSATELISRRGVFSRRHYGSVDQFPQTDLDGLDQNCRRFRLENGESLAEKDEVFGSPSTPILENPEHQTRWYFKYFLGKLHQNYVGIDNEKNPYFLSVVSLDSGNKLMPLYRAMLFKKQGTQKIAVPYSPNQKLTVKQILSHFPNMDTTKTPKEIFSADIQKDLLLLEEQEGSVNFKFGVVYMKSGQKVDDEMLSNEYGSEQFEEFLGVLGEKIRLCGWERYRGGLDVKGDMTGKYSVYTLYEGHEIMFHVSTLLPFSRDNKQQVERKRHIGNDIVNIVFIDCNTNATDGEDDISSPVITTATPTTTTTTTTSSTATNGFDGCEFVPNCIKSQFTHIFAVVTKLGKTYKLSVFCDETVPPFGPTLPNPPEFDDPVLFREFLLVKLINGEKATFQTPTFSRKRERTLEMLIKDLYEEYVHDTKMTMLNRRAFSEVLYDAPRTSKLKEDARQVEFVRIGQALKLEAIVRGDAPTSLASAGPGSVFKRPPWEPQCFYPSFHHRGVICGDSFGHDSLFAVTDDGTYLIKDDQSNVLVFDKTLCIKQMTVVEDHGILLVRGGSSSTQKDTHRIHVFRLSEFKDEILKVRARGEVKDRRIEKTRGCHLYTTAKGSDGHLRMAVAIGKKLHLYQWKHTAAWTSWCPNSDNDTADGFLFTKEISLHDNPTIMTVLETPINVRINSGIGIMICVGFKHHFEIISEQTGSSVKLHEIDTGKRTQTNLVAAVDLCDGQETELLLCYNHTCHFQKLSDDPSKINSEFDFHWNTSPTSIVCAFPYIIAFTSDSMEIRLLVNGNLVHIVTMAELQLITSKRDIYFATTAPEFIPKDLRLKWANEHNSNNNNSNNTNCSAGSSNNNNSSDQDSSENEIDHHNHIHLNPNPYDDASNLPPSSIQRVRSLQNHKDRRRESDECRRQISKSNSCGDGKIMNNESLAASVSSQKPTNNQVKQFHELTVPPNSPKLVLPNTIATPTQNTLVEPVTEILATSPIKNNFYTNNHRLASLSSQTSTSTTGSSISPERCSTSHTQINDRTIKPLRIYRIPLTNLTGAHHSHAHNPHSSCNKKSQPSCQQIKIIEDSYEATTITSLEAPVQPTCIGFHAAAGGATTRKGSRNSSAGDYDEEKLIITTTEELDEDDDDDDDDAVDDDDKDGNGVEKIRQDLQNVNVHLADDETTTATATKTTKSINSTNSNVILSSSFS